MTVPCRDYCDTFFEKRGKDFVCTTVLGIHPTMWHTHTQICRYTNQKKRKCINMVSIKQLYD